MFVLFWDVMHVRLEHIKLQVEVLCVRAVRPARTLWQQGPVHARIVSLENIKVQMERQCACLVLSIELRQSRVQHWGLVFVALVSPSTGTLWDVMHVRLEHIKIQVEVLCVRAVRPARTPRQEGPVHARIVSLENMQLQRRHCVHRVLPIRLRQSRAQHLSLVFVSLVLPATGIRACFSVLTICSGRVVSRKPSGVLFGRQEQTIMEGHPLMRLMEIPDLTFLQHKMIIMLG